MERRVNNLEENVDDLKKEMEGLKNMCKEQFDKFEDNFMSVSRTLGAFDERTEQITSNVEKLTESHSESMVKFNNTLDKIDGMLEVYQKAKSTGKALIWVGNFVKWGAGIPFVGVSLLWIWQTLLDIFEINLGN